MSRYVVVSEKVGDDLIAGFSADRGNPGGDEREAIIADLLKRHADAVDDDARASHLLLRVSSASRDELPPAKHDARPGAQDFDPVLGKNLLVLRLIKGLGNEGSAVPESDGDHAPVAEPYERCSEGAVEEALEVHDQAGGILERA